MRNSSLLALLAAALTLGATSLAARDAVRQVPGAPTMAPPAVTSPKPATDKPVAAPAASSAPASTIVPPEQASADRGSDRGSLSVMINRAKVIRLPERAQTVIIGNPAIADLTIQKSGIVVVTGKSYGVTNLIALDGAGNMLAESLVSVAAQTDGMVVVQRAFERYSYACSPVCQPSVALGDNNTYFNDAKGQADAHNAFAVSR